MATLNALTSKGLIRRDTSTSLYHGQPILTVSNARSHNQPA